MQEFKNFPEMTKKSKKIIEGYQPTDKLDTSNPPNRTDKLTFVEFVAKESNIGEEAIKQILRNGIESIIIYGWHNEDCTDCVGTIYPCQLCEFQKWFSKYYQYIKNLKYKQLLKKQLKANK